MGARLGGGAVGWISAPLVPGPGDLCLWTMFTKVIMKWRDETCVSDGPVVVGKISFWGKLMEKICGENSLLEIISGENLWEKLALGEN